MNSSLGEEVRHALHQPLHKGFMRLESKHYISFYQQHASHNTTLLKFAKLDFNLLQSFHQKELRDISGWWEELHSKVPFARDRLVEAYFWILGIYYEHEYLRARQLLVKLFMIVEIFDDIFDAYGSFEILQLFAEAVNRWDYKYIAKLPQYFNTCCQVLFETLDTYEQELAQEGRAYGVHHYRQQFNRGCQAWLREAKWKKEKYTPTFEEYMKTSIISIGQLQGIVGSYLGMGSIANKESFDWVCQHPMPKFVEACLVIIRLLNDVGSTQFEQTSREHVVSSVQSYMKEKGVSNENEVYEILEKKVEDAWKHLNHGIFRPFVIPKPLLDRILNLARAPEIFYKGRTDGYTIVNQVIRDKITACIFDPVD
ncbi:probable sesquiterpene synthase [Amaranthus tricolor]|uniref:probable sesquiterpene synthase n=1 Tax=Amaranthus tricolor TaxID=29722 RepID=UPI002583785F|nr:probable sesquiterpene synthase [Amaranthus tricolor]